MSQYNCRVIASAGLGNQLFQYAFAHYVSTMCNISINFENSIITPRDTLRKFELATLKKVCSHLIIHENRPINHNSFFGRFLYKTKFSFIIKNLVMKDYKYFKFLESNFFFHKIIIIHKMARITVEDCVKVVPNRFELCLIASNRAKAILSGSNTALDRKEKPSVIALREIANEVVDVNLVRENIINSIKNRNLTEISNTTDENIVEAISEESEPNLVLKDDTFVSENIEVND